MNFTSAVFLMLAASASAREFKTYDKHAAATMKGADRLGALAKFATTYKEKKEEKEEKEDSKEDSKKSSRSEDDDDSKKSKDDKDYSSSSDSTYSSKKTKKSESSSSSEAKNRKSKEIKDDMCDCHMKGKDKEWCEDLWNETCKESSLSSGDERDLCKKVGIYDCDSAFTTDSSDDVKIAPTMKGAERLGSLGKFANVYKEEKASKGEKEDKKDEKEEKSKKASKEKEEKDEKEDKSKKSKESYSSSDKSKKSKDDKDYSSSTTTYSSKKTKKSKSSSSSSSSSDAKDRKSNEIKKDMCDCHIKKHNKEWCEDLWNETCKESTISSEDDEDLCKYVGIYDCDSTFSTSSSNDGRTQLRGKVATE